MIMASLRRLVSVTASSACCTSLSIVISAYRHSYLWGHWFRRKAPKTWSACWAIPWIAGSPAIASQLWLAKCFPPERSSECQWRSTWGSSWRRVRLNDMPISDCRWLGRKWSQRDRTERCPCLCRSACTLSAASAGWSPLSIAKRD